MGNLSKQKVSIAAVNRAKMDVSFTHVTTGEFMQAQVAAYRHMLPGEHLKGSCFVNARLAPLAVPTYGRCRINVRNFFVPFRSVFPNFNEFITQTIGTNYSSASLIEGSPCFRNLDLVKMFIGELTYNYIEVGEEDYFGVVDTTATNPYQEDLVKLIGSYVEIEGHYYDADGNNVDDVAYDFTLVGTTPSNVDFKARFAFTTVGREMYHTLISLGYRVIWNYNDDGGFVSGLGLLCFAKVFNDWYFNSNYLDSFEFLVLEKLFKYNDPEGYLQLSEDDLFYLLRLTRFVQYDATNEYITNAWDNPTAPNSGNQITLSIPDITDNERTRITMNGDYTPIMVMENKDQVIGSQYIHSALRAMSDFVKRHQLSSARAVDRFLAEYGLNLDSSKVNRSIFISTHTQDVNFDAVFSHADTAGADEVSNLGDYSGKGDSRGKDEIDFTADEFGMFISIASILPMGGYYQGIDRNNLHIVPTDFFVNEFDNLGCQAISKGEVYISTNGEFGDVMDYQGVYGYAPRYAEYKVGRQLVSGDFVLPARFAGGDSWQLFRRLNDKMFDDSVDNVVHSLNFTRGIDYSQYNRIFQDMNTTNDKFYLVFHYALTSFAPCKSLFDSYDFEEEGKKILMDSNGPKVN